MEIWEEIAADARAGAERLVAEYGDRLFTAACRIVQNEADAEDLVFRTFESVVAKIRQFGCRSGFFSWMYSVMLNFRRMDLRRKGANALVFDGEVPEMEDAAPDPCEALAVKADAEAIRNAVDNLSEPLRTVVTLHYLGFQLARDRRHPVASARNREIPAAPSEEGACRGSCANLSWRNGIKLSEVGNGN